MGRKGPIDPPENAAEIRVYALPGTYVRVYWLDADGSVYADSTHERPKDGYDERKEIADGGERSGAR